MTYEQLKEVWDAQDCMGCDRFEGGRCGDCIKIILEKAVELATSDHKAHVAKAEAYHQEVLRQHEVIRVRNEEVAALRAKEPPLLQCADCKNTESPAGAMARKHFNHGRCMHCGGYFKVVRA